MSEEIKIPRLGKAAREFNIATSTIVEFLSKKGFTIEDSINTKLTIDMYNLLTKEYQSQKNIKEEAQRIEIGQSFKSHSPEVSSEKGQTAKGKGQTVK
jgi:translation initiation factor IF-2